MTGGAVGSAVGEAVIGATSGSVAAVDACVAKRSSEMNNRAVAKSAATDSAAMSTRLARVVVERGRRDIFFVCWAMAKLDGPFALARSRHATFIKRVGCIVHDAVFYTKKKN